MKNEINTTIENIKSLKALTKEIENRTENDKLTCFEQACLVFGVDLDEIDSTDNAYRATLIDSLPLSIKVDYINGLRPLKKTRIEGVTACKDCAYSAKNMINGYAVNPKTNKKIKTKKACFECKASNHEKFFNGCFGDVEAVFGYPEPRITKKVIETHEQIAYRFEISRRDALKLETQFKKLGLTYKAQEALRIEFIGRIPELYKVLKNLVKELANVETIDAEDAYNFISSSYYEDENLEGSDPELWYESELERSEDLGVPAEYIISAENGWTYNRFDFGGLQHQADICRHQKGIKKAIDSAKSQQELKKVLNQAAPLMRDAWKNYKEQAFSLLCDRFKPELIKAIREIRHSAIKRDDWKGVLIRLAYGESFYIGESFPIWLNKSAQNTLWKHIKQPLIRLETI